MSHEDNEKEIWSMIGFVKVSPTRYKTLKALEKEFLIPTEIAQNSGLRITQVSNALHDLKEKNLVFCENEEAKRGRIYKNTEMGMKVLQKIDDNTY
ncbi:MarR family transcriptional regulator [uncultured Methanobrevibacter sp.]|jgi:DNA-binding PadR family transcriptional regulator|uniref:MarR family transcriptional regulator n=1 Tax=uncultured Methanobrevibacter sp. TaxID=253161 RepID=UPI0025DECBFA|nr:MarR family transcriptional regulator [uncultured Methanobrevibacter sp.]